MKKIVENLNFLINLAMVTTDIMLVSEEPMTFAKAWNHPNENSCAKWQETICKVFTDMNNQQVWRKTSKTLMPPNQWCVKNKLAFKINSQRCVLGTSCCMQVQSSTWH